MEILYPGKRFLFEWDSAKAQSNEEKHEVAFEEAAQACEDPNAFVEDATKEGDEQREQFTGFTAKGKMLVVVTVERAERLRIISAREPTRIERRNYDERYRSL